MSENNEKTVIEKAEVKADKAVKTAKQDKKKKEKKPRKRPFMEMVSELKKVSWPTKADLRTYAICVLVFVLVCSLLLALIDLGVAEVIDLISAPDKLPGWLNDLFNYGG
jgi:preprotein translocase subunit SecE